MVPKVFKQLLKLNCKKTNNLTENGPNTLTDTSPKETYKWCMKRCSTSYVNKEIQIKTTVSYYYMSIKITQTQNTATQNPDEDVEQQELSLIFYGNAKTVQPFWKTVWWCLTKLGILLPYGPEIMLLWYLFSQRSLKYMSTQKTTHWCL